MSISSILRVCFCNYRSHLNYVAWKDKFSVLSGDPTPYARTRARTYTHTIEHKYWWWIQTREVADGRKEGNVLFNDALDTFYLRS